MEHTFIILFSITSAVAIAVSRTRIPYTVALVVVGLIVGSMRVIEPPALTKALLFSLFLPGLIFEAAYNLHVEELRRSWRTVTALAGPGVIATIIATGLATSWALTASRILPGFSWKSGLVFAALVSATDPISVVSLFRKLGVHARLTTLVEAESLFNDGTSIVALGLILAFVGGETVSIAMLGARFILIVCGGAAVGGAVAFTVVHLTKRLNDPMIEITLTTIAAYGSFVLAEDLRLSGVIATVVSGLVLGTAGRSTAFSPATRASVDAFWQYVAFALNSIVFLLIGFEVRPASLISAALPIAIAFVAVVITRLVIVLLVGVVVCRSSERLPMSWALMITWGGLRGALAMVLALALPSGFQQRTILIDMTFGVVIVSLLLQGLSMPLVAGRFVVAPAAGSRSDQPIAAG